MGALGQGQMQKLTLEKEQWRRAPFCLLFLLLALGPGKSAVSATLLARTHSASGASSLAEVERGQSGARGLPPPRATGLPKGRGRGWMPWRG